MRHRSKQILYCDLWTLQIWSHSWNHRKCIFYFIITNCNGMTSHYLSLENLLYVRIRRAVCILSNIKIDIAMQTKLRWFFFESISHVCLRFVCVLCAVCHLHLTYSDSKTLQYMVIYLAIKSGYLFLYSIARHSPLFILQCSNIRGENILQQIYGAYRFHVSSSCSGQMLDDKQSCIRNDTFETLSVFSTFYNQPL